MSVLPTTSTPPPAVQQSLDSDYATYVSVPQQPSFMDLLTAQHHSIPGVWELAHLDLPCISPTQQSCSKVYPSTLITPSTQQVDQAISPSASLSPPNQTCDPAPAEPSKRPRRRRKQPPVTQYYSDWTKAQDGVDIHNQLKKLYSILNITSSDASDAKARAMWARRYRNRANEKIKEDLFSDDPQRHAKAIDVISLRRKTAFGEFHIGERKALASKLNKYWRIDEMRAYNRFLRQGKKNPETIVMVQSNDEEMVKKAAEILLPRPYRQYDAEDE